MLIYTKQNLVNYPKKKFNMENIFEELAKIFDPTMGTNDFLNKEIKVGEVYSPTTKKDNEINIRCSSIGYIMTEARIKSEVLSETAKTHLIDLFVAKKYNRHSDTFNKYVNKGLAVEEDSITLYSRAKKRFFKKNDRRLHNEFINGEPDLFEGLEISEAETIIDIKSSWDLYTFTRSKFSKLNTNYYWQMQGYMALTGAKKAILAYCLIDTPETLIEDEKRKLLWRMGITTDENEEYKKAILEIENNMTYEDIPIEERYFEIEILRDKEAIERIYKRVDECREYYNKTFTL